MDRANSRGEHTQCASRLRRCQADELLQLTRCERRALLGEGGQNVLGTGFCQSWLCFGLGSNRFCCITPLASGARGCCSSGGTVCVAAKIAATCAAAEIVAICCINLRQRRLPEPDLNRSFSTGSEQGLPCTQLCCELPSNQRVKLTCHRM